MSKRIGMPQKKLFAIYILIAIVFFGGVIFSIRIHEKITPCCDLLIYADAQEINSTHYTKRGVLRSENGRYGDGTTVSTISLNAGCTQSDSCSQVRFGSSSSNIKIKTEHGEWADSIVLPYDTLRNRRGENAVVYFEITTSYIDSPSSAALRAFGESEIVVTFVNSWLERSFAYRIIPTDDYLEWRDNPTVDSYKGVRFEIRKRSL